MIIFLHPPLPTFHHTKMYQNIGKCSQAFENINPSPSNPTPVKKEKKGHSISLQSTSHKTETPQSNCPDYRKFSLASARTSTQNTPCTNRPVECDICKVVHWSYYLKKHYEENHTDSVCSENISEEELNVMWKK